MSAVDPERSAPPLAPLRRAMRDVRAATALVEVRPAWPAGLRAAIATAAPLFVDHLFHTGGGTWMSLAGFTGSLADKGGSYRTRATTIASLTLSGAVTAALGALVGEHPAAAIPATFLVAVACGLGRAYGNAGASVGIAVLNIFVISLGYPPSAPGEAVTRAAFVLTGGLWAMLVALVFWPLRPYRPAREAVASVYRAVADYAESVAAWTRTGVLPEPLGVRSALETAHAVLASVRRGRPGESDRGARLLVLCETADQLFGHLFGLSDVLESVPGDARRVEPQVALAETMESITGTTRALAAATVEEQSAAPVAVPWRGEQLRAALASLPAPLDEGAASLYAEAAVLLDRAAQYAGVASGVVSGLNADEPMPPLERPREVEDPEPRLPWLAPLRAVLAPDSLVLHYALRLGLVTAAAVALTAVLGLRRGYWVTITAVIILQPYLGATSRRALQRVLGTIGGGVLAAGLAAVFHDSVAVLVLAFVCSGVSVALLPLNYAVFSVFLTPTFVLLAEATAGDWHLVGLRIVNTVLGGALALLGSRLLWPTPEASRLPAYLEVMVEAMRCYFLEVIARFEDRSEEAGRALRSARRRVGVEIINAEESVQRLLEEHRGGAEAAAAYMTLVTYARRFTASIAALALSRHSVDAPPQGALAPFAQAMDTALIDLAKSLGEDRGPAPLADPPGLEDESVSPLLRGRMTRLDRQLRTLHDAVERRAQA